MNVEISDLTRRFGRTPAVAGVSLQAGAGVFGLLGPNGAGKTTLLRMMATVIPPSSGRLRLLGRDPASYGPRREIRRRVGYLPQSLGYYPGFTVAEFVEYFALLKDMPPRQVTRSVAAAIEQVGLGDKARSKLRTLSGGMLRRRHAAPPIPAPPPNTPRWSWPRSARHSSTSSRSAPASTPRRSPRYCAHSCGADPARGRRPGPGMERQPPAELRYHHGQHSPVTPALSGRPSLPGCCARAFLPAPPRPRSAERSPTRG
jgi:ABC-type transport system involved in cytochrome c biogenesis ATPase subunit